MFVRKLSITVVTKLGRTKERGQRLARYPSMFVNYFIRHPYAPLLSHVVVTRRCNLKCGYCTEFDRSSEPVPKERLFATIDKLSQLSLHAIVFSGGEPTLHPDLPRIIQYASKRIPRVSMISNGYKLTRDLIDELNRAGLGRIQMSIDGIEANEVTAKVLKCTEPKLRLLASYARFRTHINAVVGSMPFEKTLEIVRFARSLGFETTVQWLHDQRGQALNPHQITPSEIKSLLKACRLPVYHSKEIARSGLKGRKPWKCRAGCRYLYIDEFSIARYCSQAKELWERPIDELNTTILRRNFHTRKPCTGRCTLGCVRDSSKYDRWRKQ